MGRANNDRQDCITKCWTARTACEKTLYNHCLEQAGEHLDMHHVRVMADCIQICQVAADSMVRNSPVHAHICAACAAVCEEAARSCELIEEKEMQDLARTIRDCAASCRAMSMTDTDKNYAVERQSAV